MRAQEYSQIMAENGRKGGLAKGSKYKKVTYQIIRTFVNSKYTQQEIAEKLGVSQAMVNKYVNNDYLKIMRLQNTSVERIFTDDEMEKILAKIQLEKDLKKEAKILKPTKRLKI